MCLFECISLVKVASSDGFDRVPKNLSKIIRFQFPDPSAADRKPISEKCSTTTKVYSARFCSFLIALNFTAVSQDYSTDATHKVYVIIGNSALIKCEIPSFVSDFLSVVSWIDNENTEYFPSALGKDEKR